MSIAIDRYFVILYPFRSRMVMGTCLTIVLAIWVTASILTLPYGCFMQLTLMEMDDGGSVFYCEEYWPYEEAKKVFSVFTCILQFVIPFKIITFCYVKVCGKLWDRAKTIPGNVSARREEQERDRARKTNLMLISMVVIFVVSWLPLNIYNLLDDFVGGWQGSFHPQTLFLIAHAIAMSSTCYNPFLYGWLNENFRKEFNNILPRFMNIRNGNINNHHQATISTSIPDNNHSTNKPSQSLMMKSANSNNNNNNQNSLNQKKNVCLTLSSDSSKVKPDIVVHSTALVANLTNHHHHHGVNSHRNGHCTATGNDDGSPIGIGNECSTTLQVRYIIKPGTKFP